MATQEFANHFVLLVRSGNLHKVYDTLFDPNTASIESSGVKLVWKGIDEIKSKADWWNENHEVHGFETGDPSVNGNQFVLTYTVDVPPKMTSERTKGSEYAVYDLRDDKIIREAFFPIV